MVFDSRTQIPLDPVNYPVWGATVYLPPNTPFQYKFIRKESNGNVCFFFALSLVSVPHVKAIITKCIVWVDRVGVGSEQGGYDTGI